MVHPHRDATDETRRGRADIAGIFRIRLGLAAFDDSQGYFFPGDKTENLILLSIADYSDTFQASGRHPTRVGCHSERGFGARNLLYLAFRQKQIPRYARDDNTSFVPIFREGQ